MSILLLLIPISLGLLAVAAWFFIWAVDHDQFDDLERHGLDILDDEKPDPPQAPPRERSTDDLGRTR